MLKAEIMKLQNQIVILKAEACRSRFSSPSRTASPRGSKKKNVGVILGNDSSFISAVDLLQSQTRSQTPMSTNT